MAIGYEERYLDIINKRTAEKSAHWIFHGILDGRYAGWMVA
ncbi:MAG: hypothetical protein VX677_04230 [Candidatus Poribacteria bacterium]|nr:hypothetical protein [Candidatus Poribacteria bacterium]